MNRLASFIEFALTKAEMKGVKGGNCPSPGTRVMYKDEEHCGIFEYGFNAIGATECRGTLHNKTPQPCGFA